MTGDLRCTQPAYEPSRDNPGGDCRRPAVCWAPLTEGRLRLLCVEHRERYPFTKHLDTLPEEP